MDFSQQTIEAQIAARTVTAELAIEHRWRATVIAAREARDAADAEVARLRKLLGSTEGRLIADCQNLRGQLAAAQALILDVYLLHKSGGFAQPDDALFAEMKRLAQPPAEGGE